MAPFRFFQKKISATNSFFAQQICKKVATSNEKINNTKIGNGPTNFENVSQSACSWLCNNLRISTFKVNFYDYNVRSDSYSFPSNLIVEN